ncbi:MAG: hypothetical protein SGBAC_006283 [Bacillariaceae sp.]
MASLAGCKCLVTGASSGIGRATCQVLTEQGATVVGIGRDEKALKSLQDDDKAIVGYIVVDLAEEGGACQRVVSEAVQRLGGSMTTVVNAAGALRGGAIGGPSTTLENYQFNMKINAQVPFEIITAAVPFLKKTAEALKAAVDISMDDAFDVVHPSIVTVSSVNGLQSFPACATYCMSKAAVDQLTRCASVDLAPYGIRVNNVNPGVVKTNIHRRAGMDEEAYQSFLDRSVNVTHPLSASLGRVGDPKEVGELIAFLVSNKARFMTGECIAIDGGRQNLGAR